MANISKSHYKKANLRDLIAGTGLIILLKFDQNHRFFSPYDLEIWWMTSKNNRTPLLYYIKLCASIQIHRWIQIEVTVQKCSIRIKIGNCLSHVTFKFDGWPWKTIGHLFSTTSSLVHHLKAVGEFKLMLQSGKLNLGQNRQFLSRVTFKFDGWPWKTIRHLFYTTSSFVHHFNAMDEFKLESQTGNAQFRSKLAIFFVQYDLEISQMTLKNNRAPLGCCFKFCASFHSHQWIQTAVTVRKCPICVKIDNCFSHVTLKFDEWPLKTIGHLFYATSSFVISQSYVYSNWSYSLETAKLGVDFCDLDLWPLTSTFCMDVISVIGNNS